MSNKPRVVFLAAGIAALTSAGGCGHNTGPSGAGKGAGAMVTVKEAPRHTEVLIGVGRLCFKAKSPAKTADIPVLPPELAFLSQIAERPEMQRRIYTYLHLLSKKLENQFVCLYYRLNDDPENVPRRLEAELTKERGWELVFPDLATDRASAVQTVNGERALTLKFEPYFGRRGVIYLWDERKPLPRKDWGTELAFLTH